MFPEGETEGLYHTADATLWFFHALRSLRRARPATGRCARCCPLLDASIEHHLSGTRFGIGVDPRDGLLHQGAAGLSADLDGRQGRRLGGHAAARQGGRDQRALVQRAAAADGWLAPSGRRECAARSRARRRADRARIASIARFWYGDGGPPVRRDRRRDGDDAACRPIRCWRSR